MLVWPTARSYRSHEPFCGRRLYASHMNQLRYSHLLESNDYWDETEKKNSALSYVQSVLSPLWSLSISSVHRSKEFRVGSWF